MEKPFNSGDTVRIVNLSAYQPTHPLHGTDKTLQGNIDDCFTIKECTLISGNWWVSSATPVEVNNFPWWCVQLVSEDYSIF